MAPGTSHVNNPYYLHTGPSYTMSSLPQQLRHSLEVTAGCTEPAAIAFCASFVGKHLGSDPTEILLRIDQRTYKNSFGAGIPQAGELRGSEWALLFGIVMANPEKRLAIFSGLQGTDIAQARLIHDERYPHPRDH